MRTKVAPSESHLGHILGTTNKKTPLEAILKGFSEVPSGIKIPNKNEGICLRNFRSCLIFNLF